MDLMKVLDDKLKGQHSSFINDAKKVLAIRKRFNLETITTFDLSQTLKTLKKCIDATLQHVVKKIGKTNILNEIFADLKLASSLLEMNLIHVVVVVCRQLKHIHFTCLMLTKIIPNFEINRNNCKDYLDLAVLTIEQLLLAGEEELHNECPTFPILFTIIKECRTDVVLYQAEFEELWRFLTVGYQFCKSDETEHLIEQFKQSHPLTKEMITLQGTNEAPEVCESRRDSFSLFDKIDSPTCFDSTRQNSLAEKCLLTALKLLVACGQISIFNHLTVIFERSEHNLSAELLNLLQKLVKSKQHMFSHMIIQILRHYETCGNNFRFFSVTSLAILEREILRNELSAKNPNYIQALNVLCTSQDPLSCLSTLNDYEKPDTYRINCLILKEMYASKIKDTDAIEEARKSRIQVSYMLELYKIEPSLKNKPPLDFSSLKNVMVQLNRKVLSVELLQKMCKDFATFDYDNALGMQIVTLLSAEKLDFDVTTDAFGNDELLIKNKVEDIFSKCEPYVKETSNRMLLAQRLLEHMAYLNFYFYELYLCIIDILIYIDQLPTHMILWKKVLFCLSQMANKRRKAPGSMETDWWFKLPEVGMLPKISKYRLPFLPLIKEPLKNILGKTICILLVFYTILAVFELEFVS